MANHLLLENGSLILLEDGSGSILLEAQPITTGDFLVQEVDGISRFTLEDGSGSILLEAAGPTPPTPVIQTGGAIRRRIPSRRARILTTNEDDTLIALTLTLAPLRRRRIAPGPPTSPRKGA